MHSVNDSVVCINYNGNISRHIDGYDSVSGRYGVCQMNLEGGMLLNFCLKKELCLSNT